MNEANNQQLKLIWQRKTWNIIRKGDQDLYDLTKEERDEDRKETNGKLLTERKKNKAG